MTIRELNRLAKKYNAKDLPIIIDCGENGEFYMGDVEQSKGEIRIFLGDEVKYVLTKKGKAYLGGAK